MKTTLKIFLFLFFSLILADESLSFSDYKIKQYCKKEVREYTCIKNMKEKRLKLQQGNLIKIPVIPYEKK